MASAGKVLVFGIDARLQDVVAHGTFDFWSFRGRRTKTVSLCAKFSHK